MVDAGMCAALWLFFLIWHLKIRLSSIKVTGICKRSSYGHKGYSCLFEYEIEGIHLCNYEGKEHFVKCKEGKEYSLYIRRDNYNYIISSKFMSDLILGMIVLGIFTISYALDVIFSCKTSM